MCVYVYIDKLLLYTNNWDGTKVGLPTNDENVL